MITLLPRNRLARRKLFWLGLQCSGSLCSLLCHDILSATQLAKKHVAPKPAASSEPIINPVTYANKVSRIDSCKAFEISLWSLPRATPLLRKLFSSPIQPKSEFETNADYSARLIDGLRARVGDLKRVYTIQSVPRKYAQYDADKGVLTLNFTYRPKDEAYLGRLDTWGNSEVHYVGSNSFGLKKLIDKFEGTELRGRFTFPPDSLPTNLELPMSAADAMSFKSHGGWLHVLSALDGYSKDTEHDGATIDDPTEIVTHYENVQLIPRCAVLTLVAQVLPGWRFDRWTIDP